MKKILKIFLYIILAILVLIIGLVIVVNTPWGKSQIKKYAVSYLQDKLATHVEIGTLDFSIPTEVNLGKVLVLDKAKDTLLWINKLDVNINMLKLVQGRISINKLNLDGGDINLYRTATDTNFNYQFVLDSFVGKPQANKQEVIDTAQATPIYVDAGNISISNTRFRFNDTIGGTLFGLKLKNLAIQPRDIDLNKMRFEVEDFKADTLNSYFYSWPSALPPSPVDTSEASNIILIVDKLTLNNANFAMRDSVSNMDFSIIAKELTGAMPWFSLKEKLIKVDYFNLAQTSSALTFGKPNKIPTAIKDTVIASTDSSSWRLNLDNVLLKEIAFSYDDNTKPKQKDGIDYAHLNIYNFYLTGSDLLYSTDTISGIIKNLSTREKSGLDIQTLRTAFTYHAQGAILDELYLKTPNTLLQDKMAVSYKSLASLDKNMGKMNLDLAIRQSVIGFKDLFIFLPEAQKKQLRDYRNQKVNISLLASGPLEKLNINRIFLQGLTRTAIDASGVLYGLPDADKLRYDFNFKNLASSYNDIKSFVPKSVQNQIAIPAWFAMSGKLNGTGSVYHPDLLIKTSDGNAKVKGTVNMAKSGRESYDLALNTAGLNLGKILKMEDQFGKVSMNGNIKGIGFDPKTMNATLDAHISQAYVRGYDYKDIKANGYLKGKQGEFNLKSLDENAFLKMQAFVDLSNKYPAITSNMSIEMLNLKALHLLDQDLQFTGDINMDIPVANIDYPSARINVNNPFLTMNGTTYLLDSVYLESNPIDSIQNFNLNISNIVLAKLQGHVPVSKMGDLILAHVNKFYQINDTRYLNPLSYDMNLTGTINYHNLIKKMVPELRKFKPISFTAIANPRDLQLALTAQKLRYSDMELDTLAFSAYEQDSSLNYITSINRFSKGSIQFFNSSLFGAIKDNKISSFLNLADKNMVDQFSLGLYTYRDPRGDIHFNFAKGLKLNYDDWTVDPANRIKYSGSGLGYFIDAMHLNKGNESINISSQDTFYNSPLSVSIKNFSIANLTSMISKDTLLADGALSLDANIDTRGAFPKILANGSVDSFKVMDAGLGNLALNISNETANEYNTRLNLVGYGNDLGVNGTYNLNPTDGNELNLNASVKQFSLKSIEPMTFGNLRKSSGTLFGNLVIKGTLSNPLIEGRLMTDDLATNLAMFNTHLAMPRDTIQFLPGQGIHLDNFEILDRFARKATLDGDLFTKNFIDYQLGLRFQTTSWEAMNSTQKDNESYYGRMLVGAGLNINGDMYAPAVNGLITILDSTNFNYAMLDNPELVSNAGIVTFYNSKEINEDEESDQLAKNAKYFLSKTSSLNVNLEINKGALFTVLIDPETGDKLGVNGTASLNANLGSDGNMALAGTYELDEGYYALNIEFIKKKFNIQKGSIIQLAGDPLDAEANITAVYEAKVAPIDLIQKQTQSSDENATYYRQKLPFQILMKISGKIMKPTISFDMVVKEGGMSTAVDEVQSFVESKLSELRNNPSDMNKQVVAVLALGRFVSEDPFSANSSGLGIENAVRQSASKFLSDQLNRMAGSLINGLDVNFGLNSSEDYSTGSKVNRTDLSVSASKRLFNDRLNVSIGNDFALEGQTNASNPSYIPGNISVDYLITPDSRYVLRGYRKTELQNIVNGYVIETGLSFRLGLEYNRFRQLLMGSERYRAYMRKKREEERKKKEADLQNRSAAVLDNKYNRNKISINK